MEGTVGNGEVHERADIGIAVETGPGIGRISHRMFRVYHEVYGRLAHDAGVYRSQMRLHHSHGNNIN